MAVSIEDIKKLRAMTGAGLADVKNALNEAEGNFDKAKEILRERGLAIAAKRSDRETSNGCVLVKAVDGFAAMIAVKCETDFVANGKDFIAMGQEVLDAAVDARAKSIDEVKGLKLGNGEDAKDEEYKVAIQKTKEEQVEKAVVAAIKKAGINANLVDSEEHIESNINKGWLTREDADKAIEIKKTVGAEKAANLNENMIQNIAKGRLNKFFKDNCLVDQEFQFSDGDKMNVADWLKSQDKDLAVVAYKRFTLSAE